ncbi:hypothetical protein HNQ07_000259 [Deinococcus metalli]|uniref:Uncharacterized protein n=1 Tax=Deinococcus metalli TaxID=1141878 RepID=A0A7W8KAW0_9DEIO|nr:hypothetical protein [Deinococcus metalli]MBB5374815.1 hypothetical protein [Deinococcus metalli]
MRCIAGDVGLAFHDAAGRLLEEQITARHFEIAWTASFSFLAPMRTDSWRRRSIITDFKGSHAELEF